MTQRRTPLLSSLLVWLVPTDPAFGRLYLKNSFPERLAEIVSVSYRHNYVDEEVDSRNLCTQVAFAVSSSDGTRTK